MNCAATKLFCLFGSGYAGLGNIGISFDKLTYGLKAALRTNQRIEGAEIEEHNHHIFDIDGHNLECYCNRNGR